MVNELNMEIMTIIVMDKINPNNFGIIIRDSIH